MTEVGDTYVNEYGHSLFDRVLAAYDRWLQGIPYVGPSSAGVNAQTHNELMREVWPEVERLCIRLEANEKGELSSRVERGFRDVEDNARIIDNHCESEKFDLDLWLYGDPAADDIAPVNGTSAALLEQAHVVGQLQVDEDFCHWSQGREWTRVLGERCEQIAIDKYGDAPLDEYARHVAYWAWACFWLGVQLRHQNVDHHGAYGNLEAYLSSMAVVSEIKAPVIHEALGRAYGMRIFPFQLMESEEVRKAIDGFGPLVTETQSALMKLTEQQTAPTDNVSRDSQAAWQENTVERPWADDAAEYLPLSEAAKLIDGRLSLSTLSKWLTPDGEIRYMRKKGCGCKVHVADFRRYMQGRQGDTTFATALVSYFSAAGKGDVRFFWHCSQCGADYPEKADASVNCPKCKIDCKLIRKAPPQPRR